jgi:hypothetical protein
MKTRVLNGFLRHRSAAFTALALATIFTAAHADNLVQNGSFESTLIPGSSEFGGKFSSQQVTNWSTNGYNFVFTPGTADTTGAVNEFGSPNLTLWGPNNGGAADNNLPATSPDGGNFIAADGAFEVSAITQQIVGLVVGEQATLTFYWAAAQQYTFSGQTTQSWTVSLGGDTQSTGTVTNPEHGFTPWTQVTMFFTPTATTETLSFLAVGAPAVPPFVLLDGVSLTQPPPASPTPEPSSLALMLTGIAGAGGFVRSRLKKARA